MEEESDTSIDAPSRTLTQNYRRQRSSRVTSGQIDTLLAKLKGRPYINARKNYNVRDRENYQAGWKMLANELNKYPYGAVKTPEQWMTVWRDLKSRACVRASKLQLAKENGKRNVVASLSIMDKRILSLIDSERICTKLQKINKDIRIKEELDDEAIIGEFIAVPQFKSENSEVTTPSQPHSQEMVESGLSSRITASPTSINNSRTSETISNTDPSRSKEEERPRRTTRNLIPRRRLHVLPSEVQRVYLKLAKSNTHSMQIMASAIQMQAEAAKMQAEAAKMQAEAVMILAEASKTQASSSLMFAQAATKIADALV